MNRPEALAKWREANNNGNGYASPFGATVDEALDGYAAEGARIQHRPQTSDEIGIVRFHGELLGIGDANGPWVQVLEQYAADWTGLGTEAGETYRAIMVREKSHAHYSGGTAKAQDAAIAALKEDCKEYGIDYDSLSPDDEEEYVDAYIAALGA